MIEKITPEAGLLLRTAARDRDLGFEVTASWADVQRKAKRIRSEGGVTIVIASADGIGGEIKGDHGTYEALLVYRPGTRKVADWTCGCKWAAYAFDRSPGFKHFEGRKCSHALALQFEAQSQGMFGKEVHPSESSGARTITRYDPDTGEHVFARPYAGSLVGSLVARLRAENADPAEIIGNLMQAGMPHAAALKAFKTAEHGEGGEHLCPHCGAFLGVAAFEHHHCPHCGAPLGGEAHHHGSFDVSPVDAVDNATYRGLPDAVASADGRLGFSPSTASTNVAHLLGSDLREGAAASLSVSDVVELGASAQMPQVLAGRVVAGVSSGLAWVADVPGEGPAVGTHHAGRAAGGVGAVPEQAGTAGTQQAAGPGMAGFGTAGAVDHRFVAAVDGDGLSPAPHAGALRHDAQTSKKKSDGPSVSGIALKAHDTGRVLMLQRGLDDPSDPAAGTWEFPGGHHEEGDLTSLHAGIREFEEEVGQEFPLHGAVKHTWTSPSGSYQGHVVVIPSEKDLVMHNGRVVVNPDDPKGDCHEQACWWDIEHAKKNPALRAEVKAHTPWKDIAKASLDRNKSAAYTTRMGNMDRTAGARVWYHGTSTTHLPHIQEHGLRNPYLTSDYHQAVYYAGVEQAERGGKRVVLAVEPDHSKLRVDRAALDEPIGRKPVKLSREPEDHEWQVSNRYVKSVRHEGDVPRHQISRQWTLREDEPDKYGLPRQAAAWDPISNTNPQSGRGTSEPAHSNSANPASTGFATSEDPDNWDNLNADPTPLIPSLSFDSILHDGPEPALPTTYGDDEPDSRMGWIPPGSRGPAPQSDTETMRYGYDDLSAFQEDHPEFYGRTAAERPAEISHEDLDPVPDNLATPAHLVPDQDADISLLQGGQVTPNTYSASVTPGEEIADIVARFQRTAAGQELIAATSGGDAEIAAAAGAHLAKTAAAKFDFAEQQELIGEGAADGVRARNLGDLKIEGTHYALLDEALAKQSVDSNDLFI